MFCIGNDIVDLAAAGSAGKSRDRRFVRRVFTPGEQACIQAAPKQDVMLWSLWAAKETAFKALRKVKEDAPWAPRLFAAGLSGDGREGRVRTAWGDVHLRLDARARCIHCMGAWERPGVLDELVYSVDRIPGGPRRTQAARESACVRRMASPSLALCLGVSPSCLEIVRPPSSRGLGFPRAFAAGRRAPVDLSLSHHGRFAAFAFFCWEI